MTTNTALISGSWGDSIWDTHNPPLSTDDCVVSGNNIVVTVDPNGTYVANSVTVSNNAVLKWHSSVNLGTSTLTVTGDVTVSDTTAATIDMNPSSQEKHVLNCAHLIFSGLGVPKINGTTKTAWSYATGSIASGATSVTVADSTGWGTGDTLKVGPTKYNDKTIDTLLWNQTTDSCSVAHPSMVYTQTGTYGAPSVTAYAPVANISQNVVIHGIVSFRQSQSTPLTTLPQLNYAVVRNSSSYGVEFQQCNKAYKGTVFTGLVVDSSADIAFYNHSWMNSTAQGTHGLTFDHCVAYNCKSEAFYQDATPDTRTAGPPCNSIYYKQCLVIGLNWVTAGPNIQCGFSLDNGTNNKIVGCDVCAVSGSPGGGESDNSCGILWPSETPNNDGVWTTYDATLGLWNISHNNPVGIYDWQNTGTVHELERLFIYRNTRSGIKHGAYENPYDFESCVSVENGTYALELAAISASPPSAQLTFNNCTFSGGAQPYNNVISNFDHVGGTSDPPQTIFSNCQIDTSLYGNGSTNHANNLVALNTVNTGHAKDLWLFHNCNFVSVGTGDNRLWFTANTIGTLEIKVDSPASDISASYTNPGSWTFLADWNGYHS